MRRGQQSKLMVPPAEGEPPADSQYLRELAMQALRELAERTGDIAAERALRCLRIRPLDERPKRGGRPPIDDSGPLAAIDELLASGNSSGLAVQIVASRICVDAPGQFEAVEDRLRRRLRARVSKPGRE